MSGKNTAIFAIYPYYSSVEHAVEALKEAGFQNKNISVLYPKNAASMNFAREMAAKAPGGAMKGTGTGAAVGGTLSWLVGFGALTIPGLGPVIAAGPIMAALAGLSAGGTAGWVTDALMGMEIPEYTARRYEGRVRDGGILTAVHCGDSIWTQRAKEILERTGAQDISSAGRANSDGSLGDGSPSQMATACGRELAPQVDEAEPAVQ